MTVNNNFKPIITYLLLVDNPLVNNKIITKEANHNGYVDWKIWHSGYGHFLIRDKKWVIIIFKWERIFSLVGSDFVCNSFYIESEVVANTSDNNTIKNQKGSEL